MLSDLHGRIEGFGVVPVIAIESVESALPLADALIDGGLPVIEITFRTDAAAEVIALLKKERPSLLVGAGTVLTQDNLKKAVDCGAAFAVAPGFNPNVVAAAAEMGLPFSPGVMTPSDIENALEMGVSVMKFFPAGAAGGISMLKSMAAPYLHRGVRFIPTGGIKQENMMEYLDNPAVLAVGGTWIASKENIAAGEWERISHNARKAIAAIKG